MNNFENMGLVEKVQYLRRELREHIKDFEDFMEDYKKLIDRNEELKKENEELRGIILELSQNK